MKNLISYRILLLALCLVITVSHTFAQERVVHIDTLSVEVHFRLDESKLDLSYLGNDRALAHVADLVDSIGVKKIDSIVVVSQSSPEGPYEYNQELSHRRVATMRKYLESHYPSFRNMLTAEPNGESWNQLRRYVLLDTTLHRTTKDRIVSIIDDNSVPIEVKKRRMAEDEIYDYIYETYYPIIRNSQVWIVYHDTDIIHGAVGNRAIDYDSLKLNVEYGKIDPPHIVPKPENRDTLTFSLKTNLLYDLATVLNAEIEFPIGNHFSLAIEDVFPWWEYGNKYCLQMWEMGAELRYWFHNNKYKADRLRDHFLGAYGMSSKYDFQFDRQLNYQGEYWSAGLTYGYVVKLSERLNMEFSLSVGYLSTAYRHYFPADDYSQLWRDKYDTGRVSYIGPTKLKVALVCPVRIKYKHKEKEGGAL